MWPVHDSHITKFVYVQTGNQKHRSAAKKEEPHVVESSHNNVQQRERYKTIELFCLFVYLLWSCRRLWTIDTMQLANRNLVPMILHSRNSQCASEPTATCTEFPLERTRETNEKKTHTQPAVYKQKAFAHNFAIGYRARVEYAPIQMIIQIMQTY